jgi:internalin A
MLEAPIQTNPFPGLRSFQPDETHLFFGREDQIDNLLRRLRNRRFLAVVGTSGSGKSSLVRAGLLPALYSGYMAQAGSQWRVAILRPGNNPIAELAKALNHPDVFGSGGKNAAIQRIITETVLQRGALGLVEAVQQARMSDTENLLIVVDQFEELFRYKRNPLIENSADQAAAFVKLILEAIEQTALPIYVVLTMRSDFLGDCAQFRDLPDVLNDSQYLIPRLTRDQMRMVIEAPIKVGNGEIAPRLVGRLLNDVGDNPDQLPILQHALMRTWDYWMANHQRGEVIDVQHYEAIGRMAKALSNHADEIYQELSTQNQRVTEILFRCLTEKGQDGRGIRRLVPLEEAYAVIAGICEEEASLESLKVVIQEFRVPGRSFLMPPANEILADTSVLDLSHESLIRVWERLQAWVDQEAESARTYLRLVDRALQFNQGEIDQPLAGVELENASRWLIREKISAAWAQRYSPEFETMMEFINCSEQRAYIEEAEQFESRTITQEAEINRQFDISRARVLLSYSRKDKAVAHQLYQALRAAGREVWVDWDNIPRGSDWFQEIEHGIENCDTVVALLSPDSASSRLWIKAVSYAIKNNKRVIPVVVRDVDESYVPSTLRQLSWLFLREEESFDTAFEKLIHSIDIDLEYTRTHTRLLERAIEWDRKKRDVSFLLHGISLQEAKLWLQQTSKREPKPTTLQIDYIAASTAQANLSDDEGLAEAKQRIQQAILTEATALDLSFLELTAVPAELGQLVNLTELDLSANQLTAVPAELGQLVNLTELDLSANQLTAVPAELGQLVNLTELNLSSNHLAAIPAELGQLANLTELYLSRNQLTAIPGELGQLTNLTGLYLSRNQLTAIPGELGQLANLKELDLYSNQLTAIPGELGQLANLTELYLSHNQLTATPADLGQLANLTELNLSANQLTAIPADLGQLANLTGLNLSTNQLTAIPADLGQLTNLTGLNLSANQLTAVPEFIRFVRNLKEIDLSVNQITALPKFLKQISTLERLLLHNNPKLGIPDEILGCTRSDFIGRSVAPAKAQDILKYYFRAKPDRQPLNEAKLILVGFGNVGKTSLINRLIHNKFDPDSKKTQDIQITRWDLQLNDTEEIKLNVWDFGGQEIMHSTHQFFLTERSLYLLVLNGRQGHEDSDAEYWLELIQSFGSSSPVIVVLNKIKDHPFDVNRSALKQKYPNICEFICTDFEAEIGIDQLRTAIERETDRLEHLRLAFPASWFEIKNRLTSITKNYIRFEEYRSICEADGETDASAQDSLATHLHNLGIALNYKDDLRLRGTHVLNPHWITSGIYQLLNAPEITANKGELTTTNLAQTLDRESYPPECYDFLLELMRKFELCFRFQEDENRYLIPDLLDKQQPPEAEAFHPAECLNFRYEYPILPEGLFPRFIVRTHILSSPHLRWRTGVILEFEGNQALVKADRHDRAVTININGAINGRNRLLGIIRSDFDLIHSSFKFKPEEKVSVPAHPETLLNYQELVVLEKANVREFPKVINGKAVTLKVQDLLNGVDLTDTRRRRPDAGLRDQAIRLFYSYSYKDETLRDELEVRLKLLQRNNLIQPWHDRRILPGADWKHELDTNLERADIILLLISPDFIASDYCYEIEVAQALKRHEAKAAIVLPILIRPVNWDAIPFNHLQALPTDLKAVTQWTDRDDAWLSIEQGIEKLIREKLHR